MLCLNNLNLENKHIIFYHHSVYTPWPVAGGRWPVARIELHGTALDDTFKALAPQGDQAFGMAQALRCKQ